MLSNKRKRVETKERKKKKKKKKENNRNDFVTDRETLMTTDKSFFLSLSL